MNRRICPEIHYRIEDGNVVITGCYGTDGTVILPDKIAGQAVTAIAPYAFSDSGGKEEDLVWKSSDGVWMNDLKRISEEQVREIYLPDTISEIGKYAFYRCRKLNKMILSGRLREIGGGAFTGCRLGEVEIYMDNAEQSCLRSIVDEIRFTVKASLYYRQPDGSVKTARVLFPEHYEEAVENTPARILVTHHHGSGGYYRQCFYDWELDFKKYDELLPYAAAQETTETAAELALGRLMFPYRLSEAARAGYEEYLREHMEETVVYLADTEDMEGLQFLAAGRFFTNRSLERGIAYASGRKKTEILSFLMDERYQRFPKKRKTFEL